MLGESIRNKIEHLDNVMFMICFLLLLPLAYLHIAVVVFFAVL